MEKEKLITDAYQARFGMLISENNGNKKIAKDNLYRDTEGKRLSLIFDQVDNLIKVINIDAYCE